MSMLRASDLDASSRSELIARAEALGIDRADVLTRAELVDEIVKRTVADPIERRLARGLLGVARDLVARVVERGLHLPDAAALIRGLQNVTLTPNTPPIATVTLAEIYAGQGHRARALTVLDEVLDKEPEHAAARALREKVAALPADAVAPPAAPSSEPPPNDTLPPGPDDSPTLAPVDLPLATLQAEPPHEVATEETLSRELEPLFGVEEIDQIALVPVDDTSAVARWELGTKAVDGARARDQRGDLIVRIVAVTPSWDGPQVEIRDVEVTPSVGDWWVCDLPPGAVLRAAIGWRGERSFEPLAVALDVAGPSEDELVPSEGAPAPRDADAEERRARIQERARRRAQEGRPSEGRALSSWRSLAPAAWEAPEEEHLASLATR